jgi:CubicO group peptidase (beta-lactamase class C family)
MTMKNLLLRMQLIGPGKYRMNVTTRRDSRGRWRVCTALLACLAVSLPVFGAEVNLPDATDLSEHGITEADLSGLDKIMTDFINTGTISGCSFLVTHKGEVVYRRAHGEFTTDEQVPLASVSKPFAASAIMVLVEQGKLDLDKPVEDYLPEFEGIKIESTGELATPKFTTRHLLSHMAGFWGNHNLTDEKLALIRDFSQTLEESVLGAAQYDLMQNPGTKWIYSGVGYCVAGRVAEAALGQSFEKVTQDALFRPLGMTSPKTSVLWKPI